MNTTIAFPGLGIEEFSFSRVAFSLFGKPIYWYGLIITIGVIVAVIHAYLRSKREGIKGDHLLDLTIFIVFFGVLGARLYYVATTAWDGRYKDFVDVFAIWDGGLAIYGGIIAGVLTVIVTCKIKKINVFRVADMIAPGVMLAQAIGRWGNFCNGEAFGYEVAEGSPLYFLRMGVASDFAGQEMKYYHPTFLYESLWNLVGFILITILYKKKKFNGQNALMYLAWYGFGRMFIEGLRTDSLYVGPFRISQLVGGLCFLAAGGLLVVGLLLKGEGKLDHAFGGLLVAPPAPLKTAAQGESAEAVSVEGTQAHEASASDDSDTSSQAQPNEENIEPEAENISSDETQESEDK